MIKLKCFQAIFIFCKIETKFEKLKNLEYFLIVFLKY